MKYFNKIKNILFSKKSASVLFLAILISSAAIITPTKPANAIFGMGDITLINIQEFATDLGEGILQSFVESMAGGLASKAINGMISKYKIGSYLQYADNLSKQVYAVQAMNNDAKLSNDAVGQYVVQSMITDITTNPVQKTSLNPLLQKQALNFFNPNTSSTAKIGTGAENFMASSMNPLGGVGGQYFASLDKTTSVKSKADTAANKDISTGNGNKSSYSANCAKTATNTGKNNSTSGASAATQTDCLLQNPGAYVGNALSGELTGLFNRQSNPPNNHLSTIALALGSTLGRAFAAIAEQSILGSGSGSAAIADKGTSTTTTPSTTTTSTNTSTTPSTYGTFYALDSSGNFVTSSSSSTSVALAVGETYTINWNASGVSGSQYAAFTPCSVSDCSATSDKLSLTGSKPETISGAVQTYTLQVWGMNSGSSTVSAIETDTITIKSK